LNTFFSPAKADLLPTDGGRLPASTPLVMGMCVCMQQYAHMYSSCCQWNNTKVHKRPSTLEVVSICDTSPGRQWQLLWDQCFSTFLVKRNLLQQFWLLTEPMSFWGTL